MFKANGQQFLRLHSELQRQLGEDVFTETVDDHRDGIVFADPALQAVEQLIFANPRGGRLVLQLGVPVREGREVAVDAIFDSVSVATTYREKLAEQGIIFCSFGEAIHDHPELVKKYLGTVVPGNDNFFAALNAAVASDGTFIYVPKGVRCPMELSTYFRINAEKTGQFERTILVADEGSYVSYIEGCSAPVRDSYQLHAAVVEVIIHKDAEVKYSTVQNWFPGDNNTGGILNFVTKRALCEGENSKMSWTQSETGSAITWKYPSCILRGDNSIGEFFSVALTSGHQQADTGTKMIHIGKNTRSTIISKGISAGHSQNSYRGLVKIMPTATNARNYTQCDSMLIGPDCGAHTFPYVECRNNSAQLEHEATTSRIGEDQLFYCLQRARLGSAGLIAVAAGGRGIVAVILIIQLIVMRFQPVRLLHFQPRPVGIQTKLQHPLRLIAASRDSPNDFFINAFGQLIGLQASKKALFVVERAAGPGFDIVSCFSITRHSYSACTPKLSPQPHSCCAFGL